MTIVAMGVDTADPKLPDILCAPDADVILGTIDNLAVAPAQLLAATPVRSIESFGVVGDGVADDTAAVQAGFTWAVSTAGALVCRGGMTFLVDPLTVTGAMRLEGIWKFKARTLNQSYMVSITGRQDWSGADIEFNCNSKALYGIKAANFGRSRFGRIHADSARIWGWQFDPSGNNNFVQCDYYAAYAGGQGLSSVATQSGALSGAPTSLNSYATFNLTTPIAAEFLTSHAIYFVRNQATGLGYLVKTVVDADTLEIYNFDVGDTNTATIDIYVGGGLNIAKYGDSGVGVWGGMDLFTIAGVGLQMSSLYGHVINNAVFQTCGIGFGCNDYTLGAQFNIPYFENNDISYFSSLYVDGTMVSPKLDSSNAQMQNRYTRLNGLGEWDQGLHIINPFRTGDFARTPALRSATYLGANPSGKTLKPGFVYSMSRTTGGFTLTVDNTLGYMQTQMNSQYIILNISYTNPQTGGDLTVQLSDTATETVEGGATAVVPMAGKVVAHIYKVGVDWKVNVVNTGVGTAVTATPKYVGQIAVVSGAAYIAKAVTAATDWVSIGKPPRVGTTTSSATPTINTDNVDLYTITALAAAITSFTTNLTGTPVNGQRLGIAITDNGTARAITWGAKFEASTVALPTTTVISTRLDVEFIWNTVTAAWRCQRVS